MRYLKILLALTLIAALTVPAFGQRTPGSFSIGGFGGLTMPQKPTFIKDNYKNGIGFGGELRYNLGEKAGLAIAYSYIPFKRDKEGLADIKGGEWINNVISANLDFYATPPEAFAGFYLIVGGGYYMMKTADMKYGGEVIQEGSDESGNKFGVNGGLGLEIRAGAKLAIFVEGKYHYVFTKEEKGDNVDEDYKGKLQFITIMGGLRLSL
jgi:opacity protein-like surface antigen